MVPAHLLQNAVVVAQMSAESARVVAPALAGALISVSWFGSGGVFLAAGALSLVAALLVLRLPRPAQPRRSDQSPLAELIEAVEYVRSDRAVGAVALVTVSVVMIGFPYLTFLPTLADDRFEVGAAGFGVMSGVAGLGAFAAGVIATARNRGTRPGTTIVAAAGAFGVSLIALGLANSYALALMALAALGASGLVFQTSTQALMLRLSPLEYHGRLQSMVILGFSGFGLAALPLGLLADAVTLRWTFVGMGLVIGLITSWFAVVRHRQRDAGSQVDYG
jgi:predicted MFS family arabinose efflux permease